MTKNKKQMRLPIVVLTFWVKLSVSSGISATLLLALGLLVPPAVAETPDSGQHRSPSKPNIILFLVDDLGWQDSNISFWQQESLFQQHFRTPNVTRLARTGVKFVNAYAHCVCSPTRTSIMTGQNPARHHVTNWTLFADRDQSASTSRIMAPATWRKQGLQSEDLTLAKQLKRAGYTTIHCGKAHWGAYETPGSDPRNLGFDVNIAGHSAGGPGSYQGMENYGNNPDGSHKKPWGIPGLKKYHGTNTHLTDALAIEACQAIETASAAGPFFLYMAPYAVHAPLQPHGRFIENYRGKIYPHTKIRIPEAEARYASMVEGYDAALGAILRKVEALGKARETIIVFTSDNGGLTAHARGITPRNTGLNTHCWPLREGKGSAYEGGTRVPMIVSWVQADATSALQQKIPIVAGSTARSHVICEDLMPTLCRWADNRIQTSAAHPLDGRDLFEIAAPQYTSQRRPLLFHYPHVWGPRGPGYQPHSALRLGKWKVIYFYHSQRWELYDLENDIGESKNLAFSNQPMLKQMSMQLVSELEDKGAQYPINRDGKQPQPPRLPRLAETVIPVASQEDRAALASWTRGGNWLEQHRDINRIAARGDVDVVLLGDSITQSWGGPGRNVGSVAGKLWNEFFAELRVANFGISGDRTQHVLWRIQNGNLDGLHPKLIVMMIGTNNLHLNSAEEIALGIEQIVKQIEERRDGSKILLMGILPRGKSASDPLRLKLNQVNHQIARLADQRRCFYEDLSSQFVDSAGALKTELYSGDHLHLSQQGYRTWANSIDPYLKRFVIATRK